VSAYVQRSSSSGLIGIEILTVDARIVLASVDTYLRFAEAVNRLDLGSAQGEGLPELVQTGPERVARATGRGMVEGAKEALLG
jgi:gas vesicle structural protein